MDLSVPAEPVQDGAEPLNDAMEEEVRPAEETQEREQDTPSTLPPPPPAPQDAAAVAASSEVMQEATIEPAIAPVTSPPVGPDNAVGPTTSDGAAAEREEQNATPVPASTTISTPTPTTPVTPTPKPRPVLQGTLIGLFVAIDPATQRYVVEGLEDKRKRESCSHIIIKASHPLSTQHTYNRGKVNVKRELEFMGIYQRVRPYSLLPFCHSTHKG